MTRRGSDQAVSRLAPRQLRVNYRAVWSVLVGGDVGDPVRRPLAECHGIRGTTSESQEFENCESNIRRGRGISITGFTRSAISLGISNSPPRCAESD